MPDTCRCGFDGQGDHPCHARGYTCRKPAKQRFYAPRLVSLAGVQMKVAVSETWACDQCWDAYQSPVPVRPTGSSDQEA